MSFRIDRLNNEMRKVIADVIDNKIKVKRGTIIELEYNLTINYYTYHTNNKSFVDKTLFPL